MKCCVCQETMRFKKEIGSRIGGRTVCRSDTCKILNKLRYQRELREGWGD